MLIFLAFIFWTLGILAPLVWVGFARVGAHHARARRESRNRVVETSADAGRSRLASRVPAEPAEFPSINHAGDVVGPGRE